MHWSQVLYDISINLCSDCLFVSILGLLLWCAYRREMSEAKRFFGFNQQTQIKMYISAHEDKHTVSKKVVTAVEYEAAVEVKNMLRDLSGREFIHKIAGLIGQDPKFPEPSIEPSPLEEIRASVCFESIILIGGPLRNQLTEFYAEHKPLLKFDPGKSKYLEKVGSQYQEVSDPSVVAILVKMVLERQVVFFVFGNGEEHTRSAARHLVENWRKLNRRFPGQAFGICLSVTEGRVKEEKVILENGFAG